MKQGLFSSLKEVNRGEMFSLKNCKCVSERNAQNHDILYAVWKLLKLARVIQTVVLAWMTTAMLFMDWQNKT